MRCFLQHAIEPLDGMAHIMLKSSMVEQIMRSAISQQLVERGVHPIYILADGIFYIITLSGTGGIFIHTQLLMEEAIGRLDAVLGEICIHFVLTFR